MCKLNRAEFHEAKKCRKELKKMLYTENDVGIITDIILSSNSKNSLINVLAATVLQNSSILGYDYDSDTYEWANKYKKKIGFLGESIMIDKAPVTKIEKLIFYITRRKIK